MSNFTFEDKQYEGVLDPRIAEAMQGYPKIMRLTGVNGQGRYYLTYQDGIKVYNSGTTAIQHIKLDKGVPVLEKWRRKLVMEGKDPAVVLQTRADYGTIMHVIFINILLGEKVSLSPVPLKAYIAEIYKEVIHQNVNESFIDNHIEEYTKDILSLLKWKRDYKVKVLAAELMLKSDTLKIGTAVDLICEITHTQKIKDFWGEIYKADSTATGAKKGDPKATYKNVETTEEVIVDFKSGKKGFYDKHIMQLLTNKIIVQENLPNLNIKGCYNFAPSNWKSKPSYRFTNQDNDTNDSEALSREMIEELLPSILEGGKILFERNILSKKFRVFGGDTESALEDTYKYVTIQEYALSQLKEKYPDYNDFERVLIAEEITTKEQLKVYLHKSPDVHIEWLCKTLEETLNDVNAKNNTDKKRRDYILKNTKF